MTDVVPQAAGGEDGAGGTTAGTLLGGRVTYAQLRTGHRTGIEPVLLAASVPARPGARVLEGGTGAGAALLCLAARVAGAGGTGVEADPALAALARRNAKVNGLPVEVTCGRLPETLPDGLFDHAMANPPWFAPEATASPDARRALARQAAGGQGLASLLAAWAAALGGRVRPGGTLGFVVPASSHLAAAAAMERAGFGALVLCPLWPRAGRAARLAIVQGRRGRRSPPRVAAGLVLHEADGRFTPAAEAILRGGEALVL